MENVGLVLVHVCMLAIKFDLYIRVERTKSLYSNNYLFS